MSEAARSLPLIGEIAPSFEADTTQGKIHFPGDFKGKWVIFFSHPADFTPVCTTEFITFASMQAEFRQLNCELVGLSIDSTFSHIAWLRTIREKVSFRDHQRCGSHIPSDLGPHDGGGARLRHAAVVCQHDTSSSRCIFH